MKKIVFISIVIGLLLAAGTIIKIQAESNDTLNVYLPLTLKDALPMAGSCDYENIVFIGGSITAGAGASTYEKSYASQVGQWFINQCPANNINIKNISVGGTGSDFAVYRVEHDLDGFVPDIAFYEFAVNDGIQPSEYISKHVEALLYKLKRINANMLIFCVLTTNETHGDSYTNGLLPTSVESHAQVAVANNIPAINVGQLLWQYVTKNSEEIRDYLPDGVHPNDVGHYFYYEAIAHFLSAYFNLPAQPYTGDLANAQLADMSEVITTSCEKIDVNSEVRLICDKGDTFSVSLMSDTLGMVGRIRSDGGRLACTVDGTITKNIDFWDRYALSYDRTSYFIPFTDLGKNTHTLDCTVLDDLIGESTGYIVEILYLMLNP
ncbi:MAG: SGNH/GDSL hydrolase family protein [Anaerolineales bacterium]|jgi:lysophospholipase L1-like esterase